MSTAIWYQRENVYQGIKSSKGRLPAGHYVVEDSYNDVELKATIPRNMKIFQGGGGCPAQNLWEQIQKFYGKREEYRSMGIPHKIGFLLEGKPGGGKTTAVDFVCRKAHAELDALSIQLTYSDIPAVAKVSEIEPSRPIIYVIEDVDTYCKSKNDIPLCEMLDGLTTADNIVFIGTTNFSKDITDRMRRPGRLDNSVKIGSPTAARREAYFRERLEPIGKLELLPTLVKDSKGMYLADMTKLLLKSLDMV